MHDKHDMIKLWDGGFWNV